MAMNCCARVTQAETLAHEKVTLTECSVGGKLRHRQLEARAQIIEKKAYGSDTVYCVPIIHSLPASIPFISSP
jgi:hypothetical protein